MDRFGENYGTFVSPLGSYSETLSASALKPGYCNQPYKIYEVLEPIKVEAGIARPWFGYSGGAVQYKFNKQIEILIKEGYLKEVKNNEQKRTKNLLNRTQNFFSSVLPKWWKRR